jgi:putative tryptophan/tyrosine transport system substrate-binding protein
LLHEIVPHASTIAMLLNPQAPGAQAQLAEVQDAARMLARPITILNATSEADLGAAFAKLSELRVEALLVGADPFFNTRREQLIALATHHAIPAIYEFREFPLAGGLVSYGTTLVNAYHQVGAYTGRILKGEKPSDLPVVQPTKFELVINLKTANALGLTIPQTLLVSADEVIE